MLLTTRAMVTSTGMPLSKSPYFFSHSSLSFQNLQFHSPPSAPAITAHTVRNKIADNLCLTFPCFNPQNNNKQTPVLFIFYYPYHHVKIILHHNFLSLPRPFSHLSYYFIFSPSPLQSSQKLIFQIFIIIINLTIVWRTQLFYRLLVFITKIHPLFTSATPSSPDKLKFRAHAISLKKS